MVKIIKIKIKVNYIKLKLVVQIDKQVVERQPDKRTEGRNAVA